MRTTEPTFIVQGERIGWVRSLPNYSAAEYSLQYRYRGPGTGINVDATANANGSSFDAILNAAAPAFNITGKYNWQAWLTELATPANTFIVDEGSIQVNAGFIADETGDVDLRTPEKIALDNIDAALANAASDDQLEYEVTTPAGSRRIKRMSRKELMDLRNYYAMLVARQNAAERLRTTGQYTLARNIRLIG